MDWSRLKHDKLKKIDQKLLWHPFTQRQGLAEPPLIVRGRGVKLYDDQGHSYYDTISSWWTNLHGHGHPALVRAIKNQAKRLDHVNFSGFTHPAALELTAALTSHLPVALNRFFYSDDGSTAVEAALKMAFQYQFNRGFFKKTQFAYLEEGYHGDTLGAVGVSGVDDFHGVFRPLRLPSYRLPAPRAQALGNKTGNPVALTCPEEVWQTTEALLRRQADVTAAVIVEPLIQCVAGMQPYPADYLRRLGRLCRELGILVIYDEVATGFGRTGTFFALDQAGTVPDFLCLAKGLSGGVLPLALTITTAEVELAFEGPGKTFLHGHSFTANPIACASALASLRLFDSRFWRLGALERSAPVSQAFHDYLRGWQTRPELGDIRFLGHIGAVDLVNPETGKPWPATLRAGQRAYQLSLAKGLVLRPLGDTLYWFLPLCLTPRDLTNILKLSTEVLTETTQLLVREHRLLPKDGVLQDRILPVKPTPRDV
ncbi:MAG: adenosylmethionine--8-amino-7-oxononanoate transaminase [Spirochaetales bacterium]|nr:adenosylmethionine--8-amino-7-oxononanoate transaminase [Spirochaetales bacterium]